MDETALEAAEASELVQSCYLPLGLQLTANRVQTLQSNLLSTVRMQMCSFAVLRNIALACQKLRKFDDMKRACDEVLEKVNPDSVPGLRSECGCLGLLFGTSSCSWPKHSEVKALYRRAQARLAPISAKDTDREAAIQEAVPMPADMSTAVHWTHRHPCRI